MSRLLPLTPAVLLALSSLAGAQRVVGFDLTGRVHEFPSPLAGACLGPSDPVQSFPTAGTLGACVLPGATVAGLGDVGVDTLSDTYWVTDGFVLAEYTSAGVPITAYNGSFGALLPGLTGLGVDTSGGLLWITDGQACQSFVKPPSGSGCLTALAPAGPAFPCSFSGVPVTDVEWDPNLGELWFAELTSVHTLLPSGAFGSFPSTPLLGCAPLGLLEGLAVDTAGVVTGSLLPLLYGTDGAVVSYDQVGCCPAPPAGKVYPTATCFATPGPLTGLSYTARPNHYGTPSYCVPGSQPLLETLGQSVVGNAGFAYRITNANPGSPAALLYNFVPFCPALTLPGPGGCPLSLWLLPFPPAGMPPVNAFGTSTLPLPLTPPMLGLCIYTQGIVATGGLVDVTDAMEVIVTVP